ncbi:class I SAM-dependent methyltransferase [Kutzneria viridogrisea]|uniref:Methyltransferase type 11 domain-containing protein n=2 Tax=Kutzneria TaxID=43356 RepID=W5W6V6_9PSEU|nr:methyltransferase domain-containing protein [Kutzneria albida]AHH96246.1 hypothetical protein KALB_2878 [Kutzneria albida DSM 43870]MBA8928541.1 SAM-dependent methyltransferase [Kutzneria viridogrisea]
MSIATAATTDRAWAERLRSWIPEDSADVLALGGSLSAALTARGHRVSDIPVQRGGYDVVLSRHVLTAQPDPLLALRRWIRLLRPGGRLVLVEMIPPAALEAAVRPLVSGVLLEPLTDPALHEPYALLAHV